MQERDSQKHSIAAIIGASIVAGTWVYALILLIFSLFSDVLLQALQCNRQDFGACALQNLFVSSLYMLFLAVIFLVIPILLVCASTIFGFCGYLQKQRNRMWAIITLIHNAVFIPVTAGIAGLILMVLYP